MNTDRAYNQKGACRKIYFFRFTFRFRVTGT